MRLNLTLSQKGLVLVAIPLIFELLFVLVLVLLLHQAETELARATRSKNIVERTHNVMERLYMATETAKHVKLKTGFDDLIKHLESGILGELKELEILVADNPHQVKLVEETKTSLFDVTKVLNQINVLYKEGSFMAAFSAFKQTRKGVEHKMIKVGTELMKLAQEEKKIEAQMPKIQAESRKKMQMVLAAGIIINIVLAVSLAVYFNKGTASKLAVLMDNTKRLAKSEPLNPPLKGIDEIAKLDQTFNEMAEALAAAARKERAILENATDFICSIDESGKFINSNPACLKLIGYSRNEIEGKSYTDFIAQQDINDSLAAFRTMKETGEFFALENRMVRNDSTIAEVLWSAQWSEQDNTYYCVIHDISQRKQIERMKQEFVAMVSHDLRTPLTSVKGFLTLLETGMYGSLNENGEESRGLADSNIERLIRLINDLLDIEKMESGKLELDCSDCQLADVVEQSANAVSAYAAQQDVSIETEPCEAAIYADADRLIQVLVNLISNAVKFSPDGETVRISSKKTDDSIEVSVIDKGRGIPQEKQEAIFERFQQVTISDSKEKGGSGLGLAICKAIIDQHGGEIGVESKEGKGSTFWFRIPSTQVPLSESIAEETAKS